jgi:hypothetical protein
VFTKVHFFLVVSTTIVVTIVAKVTVTIIITNHCRAISFMTILATSITTPWKNNVL